VDKQFAVYVLSSKKNGTIYIGMTSDLVARVWQHKNNVVDGFSKKYSVHNLVYYELHEEAEFAIKREKRLKKYKREQKIKLIEKGNPDWNDLYDRLF